MPCHYKILCNSPCICDEWKSVRCGGQVNSPSETYTAGSASALMMQLLERGRGKNATVEQNSMTEQSEMEDIRRSTEPTP